MKLALSGFLFEDNYRSQSIEFPEFCAIAQAAGYSGVELRRTQVSPDTPRAERGARRRMVADQGLTVTCLTARGLPPGGPERDAFLQQYLDLCHDLTCPLLKIGSDPAWCRAAAEQAAAAGVALAANNHGGGPLATVAGTRAFLHAVGHPNFGLLYDALHLSVQGEDYLGCIPEFAPLTRNILVHSLRPARGAETPSLTTAGGQSWVLALPDEAGAQAWPKVLAAFRQQGYAGLVTVIESGWPVPRRVEVARHCARVLRTWI